MINFFVLRKQYFRFTCTRPEDSGISSSSSVDSFSWRMSRMRMKTSNSKNRQQQNHRGSTHLARQYEEVRTLSTLASRVTGQVGGGEGVQSE